MDVSQVGQVGHAGRDATEQPDQLDDGKLAIVSLQEAGTEMGKIRKGVAGR